MRRVSVIIPHFSDLAGLGACLSALERQSVRPDEIVVADNGSPEGPAAIERTIAGRARLTIVAEKGAGPARNGGVAASTGDILAFTDCDCVPEPQWLERGLQALATDDFVGGALRVLVGDEQQMTASEAFERAFAFNNRDYVLRKGFTVTANLFCPRALFDQVGGFRNGVSEDLEWCQRARSKGFRIGYAPEAAVGHPARRTWSELRRKWTRLNHETFALACEQPSGRLKWLLKAAAMPASAVIHSPRALAAPGLPRIRDRLNATAMLFRLRTWRAMDSLRLLMRHPPAPVETTKV